MRILIRWGGSGGRQFEEMLRSFGLIVGSAFAVISVWPLFTFVRRAGTAMGNQLLMFLIRFCTCNSRDPGTVYRVWMKIGYILEVDQ